jgi:uncharacterized protein YkwD
MRIAPLALATTFLAGCVIDELREDEVGDAPWCDGTRRWPRHYGELEDELLDALNAVRVRSGLCDDVMQPPAGTVEPQPELRCAARRHATFLAMEDAVGHQGRDGTMPEERVGHAGYEGLVLHELIARDYIEAQDVLAAWLENPTHCQSLYRRRIEHVGIGHSRNATGDTTAWVMVTGSERQ